MTKFCSMIAVVLFAFTTAACETNRPPDSTAGRESQEHMNAVMNNPTTLQGSGELGGETGSAVVRQPP